MTAVDAQQDKKLATELLPDRILPKVLNTFGLTAAYVFIICWITGCSIFFVPLIISRHRYRERYRTESFWRIPGGLPVVYLVALVGSAGTAAGIYYSFTLPFGPGISQGSWMTWVGLICAGVLAAAGLVYFFGRRSAGKLSQADALAHLAVFDTDESAPAA